MVARVVPTPFLVDPAGSALGGWVSDAGCVASRRGSVGDRDALPFAGSEVRGA
jgi:hypothetical protein